MALTVKQIDAAKPKEKPYKIRDIEGLYLYVSAAGSKTWKCDCDVDGRRTTITYGKYPEISLADARLKNLERKKAPEAKKKRAKTFREVAREWLDVKIPELSNAKHQHQTITSVEQFISRLGDYEVDKIHRTAFVETIKQFGDTPESARRLAGRVTMIMNFAMDMGYLEQHSANNLSRVLPSVRKSQHMACIDVSEAPKLFRDIMAIEAGISRLGLMLLARTFSRTSELINAKIGEFDLENKVWVIPAERMKLRNAHVVPLSWQSIKLVETLIEISTSDYLMDSPAKPGFPVTDNSLLFTLYRLGYRGKMTGHGFRALASTVLNQQNQFNKDWIERQLAHKENDEVRDAYNRADYFDQRVTMMQWYSDWIDSQIEQVF